MMEKVKLTQEQADAIEELLKERTAESIVREKANPLIGGGVYIGKSNQIIFTETELDTIIRALYIGYEVEPEFKVGDWVINYCNTRVIGKIEDIVLINGVEHFEGRWSIGTTMCCLEDAFKRHATPEEIAEEKERRWWEGIGRCVRQFKEGDIVNIRAGGILHREVNFINYFSEVGVVEDFSMYKPHECELVCRVEDRKDVKE